MRLRLFVILLVLAVACSGCAGNKQLQAKLFQMARTPPPEPDYRIAPPDSLSLEVKSYPEYSRQVMVRSDGKITVPSIGDIYIKDMTVPEASAYISEALAQELPQPSVTLTVTASTSKAIYLFGEVRRPGNQPYYGDMNVIDAIASAGGFTLNAETTKVKVTREDLDKPEVICVNLKKLIQNGAAEQNVIVQAGDVIYIPPTGFAKVGYAMNQVLFPFRAALSGIVTYHDVNDSLGGGD